MISNFDERKKKEISEYHDKSKYLISIRSKKTTKYTISNLSPALHSVEQFTYDLLC